MQLEEQIKQELSLLYNKVKEQNEINIAEIYDAFEEYNKQIAKKAVSKRKERLELEQHLNNISLDFIDNHYDEILKQIREFNEFSLNQVKNIIDNNLDDYQLIDVRKSLIDLKHILDKTKLNLYESLKELYKEIPKFVNLDDYIKSQNILIEEYDKQLRKYNEDRLVNILDCALPLISLEIKQSKKRHNLIEIFVNILTVLGMNCDITKYKEYEIKENLLSIKTNDEFDYKIIYDKVKNYYQVIKLKNNKIVFQLIHLNEENCTYINDGDEYIVNNNERIAILLLNKLLSGNLTNELSDYLYNVHSNSIYKEDVIFMNEVLENIINYIKDKYQLDDVSIIKIINANSIYKLLKESGSILWRINPEETANKIMENVSSNELKIYQNEKNSNIEIIKEVIYKISLIGKVNIVDAYNLYENSSSYQQLKNEELLDANVLYENWFDEKIVKRYKKQL